jgi:phthiodiolone/phenolphthiodiolone dimycocerosates ketoreductase
MLKVGLVENLVHTRYGPTALPRASYLTAVATGMDSFWLPDHLNSLLPRAVMTPKYVGAARLVPDVDAYLEPWTMLGNFAARNRLGRLRLGTAVTDVGRRNPAVTAQAAATLHLLTRGRAILGIGTGEREGNEPYGVDWSKPVARFEEAMATIRVLWNSGGELVTRDSPFFPLHNAIFALPPYRGKWPEIWIAAHGPRMLRATGRYADAWFPAATARPKNYAAGLEKVRAAASDAGARSVIHHRRQLAVRGDRRQRRRGRRSAGLDRHEGVRTQRACRPAHPTRSSSRPPNGATAAWITRCSPI